MADDIGKLFRTSGGEEFGRTVQAEAEAELTKTNTARGLGVSGQSSRGCDKDTEEHSSPELSLEQWLATADINSGAPIETNPLSVLEQLLTVDDMIAATSTVDKTIYGESAEYPRSTFPPSVPTLREPDEMRAAVVLIVMMMSGIAVTSWMLHEKRTSQQIAATLPQTTPGLPQSLARWIGDKQYLQQTGVTPSSTVRSAMMRAAMPPQLRLHRHKRSISRGNLRPMLKRRKSRFGQSSVFRLGVSKQ